jgi:hypothetical protein
MNDVSIWCLPLAAMVAIPVVAYAINRRQKANSGQRIALSLLSSLLTLVAFVGTFGYAVYGLEDFRNPSVSFLTALLGNLLMWAICFGAWFFAIRFLLLACRKAQPLPKHDSC